MRAQSADRSRRAGEAAAMTLYLTCVMVTGIRIFSDSAFLGPAFGLIALGQILWIAPTLLGLRPWIGGVLAPFGLIVALIAAHAPGTFARGLPTMRTWEQLRGLLAEAGPEFTIAVSPVPYAGVWPLAFGLLISIVVVATQFLAGQRRAVGTLMPGIGLLLFLSALGEGALRPGLVAGAIVSAYLLAATLRGPSPHSVPRLITTGGTLALVGLLAVPYIPGADADPWVVTRGRFSGGDDRLSPLVDIQARLVNQSTVEMFTVEADTPAYWRMIALGEFDGRRFTVPRQPLIDVSAREERALRRTPRPQLLEQTVVIGDLGDEILPGAATPIAVAQFPSDTVPTNTVPTNTVPTDTVPSSPGAQPRTSLRWYPDQAAVRVVEGELQPGDTFVVRSLVPTYLRSDLDQRTAQRPPDPIYLSLPEDFPSAVTALTTEVVGAELRTVAGAAADIALESLGPQHPFVVARTLQDWFRTEFDYSLQIPAGHSGTAIENFLNRRSGYCEQFAATFVAMARSLGVPSRVAVGFTPGILRAPGVYVVQGRHAHAWPEVWFDDLGWVPFEPTPGRGVPGSEDHTGVPAAQDGPSTVASGGGNNLGIEDLVNLDDLEDLFGSEDDDTAAAVPASDPDTPAFDGTRAVRAASALALGVAIALALAGPWLIRRRRNRSLRRRDSAEQVLIAWDLSRQRLRAAGVLPARPDSEGPTAGAATALSPAGISNLMSHRRHRLAPSVEVLATFVERLGFSPTATISETELAMSNDAAARIERHLRIRTGRVRRFVAYFAIWRDPHPGRQGL